MSEPNPIRVEEIFQSAADLKGEEQETVLRAACGSDLELRSRVEALLAADGQEGALLGPLSRLPAPGAFVPGTQLGSWSIVRELSHGGMGAVYLAERTGGQFHQQAALKVIGFGLSDPGQIRRFLRERQILARLEHPSIARLLDGGLTAGNQPYFVLEYVDGVRIDRYCNSRSLEVRDRLRLFLQLCAAIQYAHRNLIIHLDIKPSNVLVTSSGDAQVKLLDFGIARLLADHQDFDGGNASKTDLVLTLDYASPEQARGEPLGTATDIYSLGTVLYELLAGAHPLGTKHGSFETSRRLQDTAPLKPSEVATNPRDRATLRGDLDRIVLCAIQKEQSRRYSSVEAFATDIQRYLDGYPVAARGDSPGYRAAMFIRRNRAMVGAAAVLALVIAGSIAALLLSVAATERQRVRAERRFGEIREVAWALIFDIDPLLEGIPGTTPVRKLITDKALVYLGRLAADAGGDPALERELATGYAHLATIQGMPVHPNLGDDAGARASLRKSLALIGASLAGDPDNAEGVIQRVRTLLILGQMELLSGDPDASLPPNQEAVKAIDALLSRTAHPTGKMLNTAASSSLALATSYAGNVGSASLGEPVAAIGLMEKSGRLYAREVEARERAPNPRRMNMYQFSNRGLTEIEIGAVYLFHLGRPDEAEAHARKALEIFHSAGNDLTNTEIKRQLHLTEGLLARIQLERGEVAAAIASSENAMKLASELLRADPANMIARTDLISVEILAGQAEAAAGLTKPGFARIDRALLENESLQGPSAPGYIRPMLATSYLIAATAELAAGGYRDAELHFARSAEMTRESMLRHPSDVKNRFDFAMASLGTGKCLAHRGNRKGAAEHKSLAAAAVRKVLELHPGHPQALKLLAEASVR